MQLGAAYIRVSTDDQTEYSPEAQINAIREYAKRNDIILVDDFIFRDEGISGRRAEKRPAFQKMIAIAKSKPKQFDVILVHKFDRFARNREDSVVYKSLLRKECGIKVVSITEQLEDDKFSIILESMLEAMAEYYSLNLAEEVKKGMTEKARRGEVQSTPPFGYKVENSKYMIDKENALLVKEIFKQFLDGVSYFKIARHVNALGAKTRRGNLINTRSVQYIINNPAYIGKVRWNPMRHTDRNFDDPDLIIADGQHEAIIDEDTFYLAQKRANKIRTTYKKYHKPIKEKIGHWLSGVVHCSQCGTTLVRINAGKGFQCGNYNKGTCKVSHFVKTEDIEKIVLEALYEDSEKTNKKLLNILKAEKFQKNDSILEEQLKRAKLKLERINSAFENGIDTIDEYKEKKKKIVLEISEIETALKDSNKGVNDKDLKKFSKNIHDVYNMLKLPIHNNEEKNTALKEIIKEIIYHKSKKEISVTYVIE